MDENRENTESLKDFKKIRESAEMYRVLYDSAQVAIFLMKNEFFVDCNARTLEMFRCKKEDIIGKVPYKELSPYKQPDGRLSSEKAVEKVNAALQGKPQVFEWQHRRPDGSLFFAMVSLNRLNLGEGQYIQAIVRDISRQKDAEMALQASEERYRHLFDNVPVGIYRTTPDGQILIANPVLLKMLGFSSLEELLARHREDDKDVILGYSRVKFKKEIEKYGRINGMNAEWKRQDGSVLLVSESAVAIRDESGRIKFYDGVIEDITERRLAEKKIEESEVKYRTLVEQSNCMIYIFRHDKLLFVNNTTCEALGYTRQELYNMNMWDLVFAEDLEKMKRLAHKPIKRVTGSDPFEARLIKKDGSIIYCQFSGGPVMFENKPSVMGIARDFTEIRRLETEVRKIDKLESLGLLAGGIAHDFNNLLTGIMGHISLALVKVHGDEELKTILKEAENASVMAKKLTQQLLTFSSGGAPVKETTDIKQIIEETTRFILRGSNVKGEFYFAPEMSMVDVDRDQFSQVISNLATNAVQAMPDGGVLKIKAKDIYLSEANKCGLKPGKYLYVLVADTGIGIPEEIIDKIFDPYFSTKVDGTGIGLATSFSIVRRHNGLMQVSSKAGKGTVFRIYLPVANDTALQGETDDEDTEAVRERILLMDDKVLIQKVAADMLKSLGYTVDMALDGKQAVQMYKTAFESGAPYACVILDLVVPKGMGGKESLKKILDIDPDAVAIVSSGYSSDPVMANYRKYGFKGVVAKPYLMEDLARVLRRAVNGRKR